jgi:uncharacterized protein
MPLLYALFSGIVFGAGLAVSDMVNPARVLNFLDLAGHWDPTLIFVMGGGLAVTALGYRLVFRRGEPLAGGRFNIPTRRQIDLPLVGGSALFGIGWGLTGICPGPAITDLMTLEPKVWIFVAAMLVGMLAAYAWRRGSAAMPASRPSP